MRALKSLSLWFDETQATQETLNLLSHIDCLQLNYLGIHGKFKMEDIMIFVRQIIENVRKNHDLRSSLFTLHIRCWFRMNEIFAIH